MMEDDSNIIQDIKSSDGFNSLKKEFFNRPPVTLEICVTNACNQNCSYCFEKHAELKDNIEEQNRQLALLDRFCENFDANEYSTLELVFWGGEPMVNLDYVKQIISLTCRYEFVHYFMYTNGTLLNKFLELVNYRDFITVRDRFGIQISYDGEPHNTRKRGYSYEKIERTMQLLSENGVKVKFKATLTYDMVGFLPQIWKSYEDLYIRFPDLDVSYCPTLDTMQTAVPEQYFEDWQSALEIVAGYEYSFFKKHGHYLFSWFDRYDDKCFCGIDNRLMLNADGNIYVCHGCPYAFNCRDMVIENTKNIDDLEPLLLHGKNKAHEIKDTCKKCGAVYCNNCHVTFCDAKNWMGTWTDKFDCNAVRCSFFKYFGRVKNALDLAILIGRESK